MFVFLSKLLPPFVYPLGMVCMLVALALVLARRARLQRIILIVALLLLYISSTRWVALGLARSLEWRYLPPEHVPQADVIVLLGGGTQPAEAPRPMVEVNGAGDRLLYAAWLYKQSKAPHILVTGGLLDWTINASTPAQDMATLLELMGVPVEAIWLEDQSRNTYENALYSAKMLKERGIQRILLVTSASHMPRSVGLFEAQGLEVVPLPTDFTVTYDVWQGSGQADWRSQILGLLPSADYLALTSRSLKEYLGIWVYSMRGWQ